MRGCLKFCALIAIFPALCSAKNLSEIATSKAWLKLLHYRQSRTGTFLSEAESAEFFLALQGRTNPLAELQADFQAFQSGNSEIICRFPARFSFLKSNFPSELSASSCAKMQEVHKRMQAKSITLVFSSYFPGAPSSMFGHTFLRFDKADQESAADFALEYAALTEGDSAFMQAPKGLFGFYGGEFSSVPYYVKIKEYNNAENRDLFEYKLNFALPELDLLIDHLWEMQSAHMHYYFLRRNCSYEVLALLEAIRPDLDLTKSFQLFAIPVDTVRSAIRREGLLKSVKFRPSLQRRLNRKFELLSSDSQRRFFQFKRREGDPAKIDDPLLAEAAGLSFAIKQIENKGELSIADRQYFNSINIRRSQLPSLGPESDQVDEVPRPDLAHESSRLSLGFGGTARSSFLQPGIRPALNDLNEKDAGFTPYSGLEIFRLAARVYADQTIAINEFTPLKIASLNPYEALHKNFSYKVEVGFYNPLEANCEYCLVGNIQIGAGIALSADSQKYLTYGLITGQANFGSLYDGWYRAGPGVQLGSIMRITNKYRILAELGYSTFASQTNFPSLWSSNLDQGYSWSTNFESHLKFRSAANQYEGVVDSFFFF